MNSKATSVVLTVTAPFNASFIPASVAIADHLPAPLTTLKSDMYLTMEIEKLKRETKSVTLKVTEKEVVTLEAPPRKQSKCKLWFKHNADRITSSNMKSVCSTNLTKPSLSLIKKICHPNIKQLSTNATQWGIKKENIAITAYTEQQAKQHQNLTVKTCGLHIHPAFPHIGASPDGIVQCSCCGVGTIEVKCPYKYRDGKENIKLHP